MFPNTLLSIPSSLKTSFCPSSVPPSILLVLGVIESIPLQHVAQISVPPGMSWCCFCLVSQVEDG